jgi:formylmethanofuran dehydrogenase subunit C
MPISLRWKDATALPVEAGPLRPDALAGQSADRIAGLPIRVGNTTADVGDLFDVSGELSDGQVMFEGDLRSTRGLASGLTEGRITIHGDAGLGVAARMSGGVVEVFGSVGDGAGQEMRGGFLRIHGTAGHGLGGAAPGSRVGMKEGVILADGGAGDDVGLAMRRGLVAVAGAVGNGVGRAMVAGSVFVFGTVSRYPGLSMRRGTLALFGGGAESILPTFAPSGFHRPHVMSIYLRRLATWGFSAAAAGFSGPFARYNGDLVGKGQGEILVWEG